MMSRIATLVTLDDVDDDGNNADDVKLSIQVWRGKNLNNHFESYETNTCFR